MAHVDSMRSSQLEALIENIVREQVPELGDGWFWGSVSGGSARGADRRSLYAYWRTNPERFAEIAPKMESLRKKLESLDGVAAVHIREYEPDTGYTGPPQVGEQWEIRLNVTVG